MDNKEKLKLLLRRKEKADSLTTREKLKWKNEIIKIEQEIKALKIELEREELAEEEKIILDILALNKSVIEFLYEKLINKDKEIIEEFINEIIVGIYDYFKTKNLEELRKSKAITNVLLDTIYQNCKDKINKENDQLEFIKTNESTPWG